MGLFLLCNLHLKTERSDILSKRLSNISTTKMHAKFENFKPGNNSKLSTKHSQITDERAKKPLKIKVYRHPKQSKYKFKHQQNFFSRYFQIRIDSKFPQIDDN